MMRRWAFLGCISLLTGVIVTVAVAWAAGVVASPGDYHFKSNEAQWPEDVPDGWAPANAHTVLQGESYDIAYRWQQLGTFNAQKTGAHFVERHHYGWPAYALTARALTSQVYLPQYLPRTTTPESLWRTGITIGDARSYRRLALRPIPSGFLLNTLFYAAIFLALYTALRTTRRHLRTRRGHCPICNYNLSGLPQCPECGYAEPT